MCQKEFWGHLLQSGDNAAWDQEVRSHLCLISHHSRRTLWLRWWWWAGQGRAEGAASEELSDATLWQWCHLCREWVLELQVVQRRERIRRGWGAKWLWGQLGCSMWAESTEVPVNAFVRLRLELKTFLVYLYSHNKVCTDMVLCTSRHFIQNNVFIFWRFLVLGFSLFCESYFVCILFSLLLARLCWFCIFD